MKITELIKELTEVERKHGNIEVTCTHSLLPDNPDVFETTVENMIVRDGDDFAGGIKRVRLYL